MIRVSEQSAGNVVILEAEGKLTHQDYKDVLIPRIEAVIRERGKARVLFELGENFRGWDWDALWDDARFGLKHRKDFEKMAVVSNRRWINWATKISAKFVRGDIRTFPMSLRADARTWIKT